MSLQLYKPAPPTKPWLTSSFRFQEVFVDTSLPRRWLPDFFLSKPKLLIKAVAAWAQSIKRVLCKYFSNKCTQDKQNRTKWKENKSVPSLFSLCSRLPYRVTHATKSFNWKIKYHEQVTKWKGGRCLTPCVLSCRPLRGSQRIGKLHKSQRHNNESFFIYNPWGPHFRFWKVFFLLSSGMRWLAELCVGGWGRDEWGWEPSRSVGSITGNFRINLQMKVMAPMPSLWVPNCADEEVGKCPVVCTIEFLGEENSGRNSWAGKF